MWTVLTILLIFSFLGVLRLLLPFFRPLLLYSYHIHAYHLGGGCLTN
jgi:hypothetical protein